VNFTVRSTISEPSFQDTAGSGSMIKRLSFYVAGYPQWEGFADPSIESAIETLEIMRDNETLKAIEEGLQDIKNGRVIKFEDFLKNMGMKYHLILSHKFDKEFFRLEIIASVTDLAPVEMDLHIEKLFCCVAGAERMWMEDK